MQPSPGVWGIDIGQCALKALRVEEIDGVLTATAFDYVEHPKILSQPDADPDQLTREALEKFLSRNALKGDIVAISVPGQSGLARFVKLPPVEEKKIADIVRFEAKQQIPFNLDEVVWDYQRIGSGEVTDGFALDIEIGLFAMKRDMINRYLQHFKEVGVEIHYVQMAPLALCNFVSYDLLGKGVPLPEGEEAPKHNCVVALDIGADSSNLVITDADRVIWQRPIPLGGNHFTRALTKEMKLTFAKAEHLKRNAVKSPDLKKILTALKPVLNDFVGEVQRSLGYFTNTHRNAQIDYLVGLGNAFRLPGLQRYLGEKLQLEVKKLPKMEHLTGDAVLTQPVFSENILTFGVAYGLALQGLKKARLMTNLLPNEIRVERLVKAKKPWAVAAAALLLLGAGALAFKAARETRAYANDEVATAVKNADSLVSQIGQADSAFTSAKAAAKAEEANVRSIVAGQPEYKNWIEFVKYVNDCVPQPDGTNLPDGVKKLYMETIPNGDTHPTKKFKDKGFKPMTGKMAYELLQARLAGNKSREDVGGGVTDELGLGIDDLVQINIQSFDARFTDDLSSAWEVARNTQAPKEDENIRPKDQVKKSPMGKGWVVEVQGYTYHHRGTNFVRETLLENFAAKGINTPETSPMGGMGTPMGGMGTPMGAPKPAATADSKGDADLTEIPPDGPVFNRISNVMLYKVQEKNTNDLSSFEYINRGYLGELARGAAGDVGPPGAAGPGGKTAPPMGTTGGPPGAGPGGPGGSLRDKWTPLVGGDSVGGPGTPGGAGSPGMPKPPKFRGDLPKFPGNDKTVTGPTHQRTEFVLIFFWREPTPSAALRKEEMPPEDLGGQGGPK
jgi:type IV pilus assembly protein PilM